MCKPVAAFLIQLLLLSHGVDAALSVSVTTEQSKLVTQLSQDLNDFKAMLHGEESSSMVRRASKSCDELRSELNAKADGLASFASKAGPEKWNKKTSGKGLVKLSAFVKTYHELSKASKDQNCKLDALSDVMPKLAGIDGVGVHPMDCLKAVEGDADRTQASIQQTMLARLKGSPEACIVAAEGAKATVPDVEADLEKSAEELERVEEAIPDGADDDAFLPQVNGDDDDDDDDAGAIESSITPLEYVGLGFGYTFMALFFVIIGALLAAPVLISTAWFLMVFIPCILLTAINHFLAVLFRMKSRHKFGWHSYGFCAKFAWDAIP